MAELRWNLRVFLLLAGAWVRVSLSYRASFVVMSVSALLLTGLDFVAIVILFGHVHALAGFGLADIAFLYGASSLALGFADLVVGNVERVGRHIRLGSLDVLMLRPAGVLVQVAADQFALRRVARILQGAAVFGWALASVDVAWTPARVAVVVAMLASGTVIMTSFFVLGAAFQFVSVDAAEVSNAFTYGGSTLTQWPLAIYPHSAVLALTLLVPVGFVNWYPALFVLDRADPFGLPSALQLASPLAAAATAALAAVCWRAGVRHYRSTGS